MESSYDLQPAGTATGNVTFYPEGERARGRPTTCSSSLDDEQRAVLEQAAAQTREWAIEARSERRGGRARLLRRSGGAVVLASDAEIAALERATAPVYAELERDERTRELIEAIRARKDEVAAATPPRRAVRPGDRDGSRGGGATDSRSTASIASRSPTPSCARWA